MSTTERIAPIVQEYIAFVGASPVPDGLDLSLDALRPDTYGNSGFAITEGCRILTGDSESRGDPDDYFQLALDHSHAPSHLPKDSAPYESARLMGVVAGMLLERTNASVVSRTKSALLNDTAYHLQGLLIARRELHGHIRRVAERVALAGMSAISDERLLGLPALNWMDNPTYGLGDTHALTVTSLITPNPPRVQIELACLNFCDQGDPQSAEQVLAGYGSSIMLLSGCCDLGMWPNESGVSLTVVKELAHVPRSLVRGPASKRTALELGTYLQGVMGDADYRRGTKSEPPLVEG